MAGKAGSGAAAVATSTENPAPAPELSFDDLAKGFEDITVPEIEGWFKPEVGALLAGQIVHFIEIEQKATDGGEPGMRKVLLVRLSHPCKNIIADGDKSGNPVTFEKGRVVGLGVRHKITQCLDYVAKKGTIVVQATEKENIGGGRTMWHFKVAAKGEKAPLPVAAKTEQKVDGDIPF